MKPRISSFQRLLGSPQRRLELVATPGRLRDEAILCQHS
jgi:hypothetical protein